MLSEETFNNKMGELSAVMKRHQSSDTDAELIVQIYYSALMPIADDVDFIEACDQLMWTDEWFPSLARLRSILSECKTARLRRDRNTREQLAAQARSLVCGTCHGARWVRIGGASPVKVVAGDAEARVKPCPGCTANDRYDPQRENLNIQQYGGVEDQTREKRVTMGAQTWPDELAGIRTAAGLDMDALYRFSRELRGLDPDVDNRFRGGVAGWKTVNEIGIAADD